MKIQFWGAAGTVTGSRYLVTANDTRVLIDCGLFQGFKHLRLKNWSRFPIAAEDLDAVLLTHAHLDHSGYLPLLVKSGFRGPVYATKATIDLCQILLPDSGYLQEEEAKFANKHGYSKHRPALPLYTYEDAKECLNSLVAIPWGENSSVSRAGLGKIDFEFHPAGHLPGAASVLIKSGRTSVAFSGDLGRKTDPLLRDPHFELGSDYLLVESTYGNRKHPERNPEDELKEVALRTLKRKGTLLIPSFAVGRAQLILYYIHQLINKGAIPGDLPVYLNSPMAAESNRAFAANAGEFKLSKHEIQNLWRNVRIVQTPEESKALNEKKDPAIIIAASGMATGGRVLHHLKSLSSDPRNTILFVGFQAGGTRGDSIVRGAKEVKIHGQYWPIHAEVVNLETLSAHADSDEIMAWISGFKKKPKAVFVTHGEPEAADALRHRIEEELRIPALVPEHGQEMELP